MDEVVATLVYSDVTGFPTGSVVDHILVTLTGTNSVNNQSQSVAPSTATVTFSTVAADTYTVSAQAFPATGAGYGTAVVSAPVTSTGPVTITLSLPASVSAVAQ